MQEHSSAGSKLFIDTLSMGTAQKQHAALQQALPSLNAAQKWFDMHSSRQQRVS
jgi:hypothetical protein